MRRLLRLALPAALAFACDAAMVAAATCPPAEMFGSPSAIVLGEFPVSVATADLNADGHLDIAVTVLNEDRVAVMLGHGDGTFEPQVLYPAGHLPRGIAIADLDDDGVFDLAVSNLADSAVSILRGLRFGGIPTGQFAAPVAVVAGWENRGIVATDVDQDGYPDLVVAGRTAAVVLRNQGGMDFERSAYLPTPGCWSVTAVHVGSRPVVVAANWTSPRLDVFVGRTESTASAFDALPPIDLPGGSAEIVAGDVNGDGWSDLVAPGAAGLRVLMGTATPGVFGPPVAYESGGGQMNDATIADFNADGHPDLAATDTDLQEIAVLPGAGDGSFGAAFRIGSWAGPNGIDAADADHDGLPDLFVVHSGTSLASPALFVYPGRCGLVVEPRLTDVRDVPHDQGGRVSVTWLASGLDRPAVRAITGYRVWRRIHAPGVGARVAHDLRAFVPGIDAAIARPAGTGVTYWEPIAEVPAVFLEGYGVTAPTTQDSIAGSNPYTAFFVQALTSDPFTFYSSDVDSGYSVDDLAPPAPMPFIARFEPGGTALHWGPSAAPDFALFRLHRGPSVDFEPGADNLVTAQPDTGYFDAAAAPACYKLAAVDVHGNVGRWAIVPPDGATAALATLLAAEAGDGMVRVRWYVSADEPVTCTVYRRTAAQDWSARATVTPDGGGYVAFEDGAVEAGTRYGYRLGVRAGGAPEVTAGEGWIDVPAPGADPAPRVPNPVVGGDVTVSFAAPAGRAVRVELLDIAGRVVASRVVAGGGGRTTLALAPATALAPGLYLVRIGLERPVVARVAVLR